VALALLALLLAGGFVPLASAQGGAAQSGPSWWNNQFGFRESLTLTNPFSSAITAYPFFVYLAFPPSRLSDASAELRVVDQSGQELQSTVLDQGSSNGSVAWAWLLIPASISPSGTISLEVYYGNSAATLPSYRAASASANASAGPIALGLSAAEPGSSSFQIAYQGTYNQSFTSKVMYVTDAQHSYGAQGLASEPETVASPWQVFSLQAGPMTVASSAYSAGEFRLSQAVVIRNGSVTVARLLTTANASSVSDLTLTDYVDSSQLSTLGQAVTRYSPNSGVLSSSVDGADLAYASNTNASTFEVGTTATVVSEVSSNTLTMNAGPASAAAAALSWDFGGGAKVGAVQLLSQWTVTPNPSGIQTPLPPVSSGGFVAMGPEEALSAQTTHAESFWSAEMPMQNASISRAGLSLPVSPSGAQPVGTQLGLNGTVSYTVPSGIIQGWDTEAEPTGNATATATTGFYSVQVPGFVDSTRVVSQDANSRGDAQLVSPTLSLLGSVSRSVLIRYKATLAGGGVFSQQSLYAALDVGSATGGVFGQTLLIPAVGSAQSDACASLLATKNYAPAGTPTVEGNLVADGSWRTLKVDLNSIVGSGPTSVRLRFCSATTQPFAGQVELDVEAAGISVTSQATNFLVASVPTGGSAVDLSYIPGASFEPASLVFTGDVSFSLVGETPLVWDGRAAFTGTVGWPTIGTPAKSTNSTSGDRISLLGARIFTPLISLNPLVQVNGTSLRVSPTGQTIDIAPGQIYAPGTSPRLFDLALSFPDYSLTINVADSAGVPLPGASIAVSGQGTQTQNATTTNAQGVATLPLMNGTYGITVSLGGSEVGTANVQLVSNQSVKISTQVDMTTLKIKDILGSPMQGASVSVTSNSEDLNLTTDSAGSVSFPAVANVVYGVSVSVGGEGYYAGTVTTSIYGAVIQISTSYLAASMKVVIVSGLVLTLVVVSSGVYLLRRRQGRKMP